jgi:two-component system NtrC family sensor kinase
MVLKSAYPVLDTKGEVLGVLVGPILFNRNYEIVNRIKNIVFRDTKYKAKEIGAAILFLGKWRIIPNIGQSISARGLPETGGPR